MNKNEEVLERVYVNQSEGYTYQVFDNSFLTLTEEYSNAPLLKWEWVYDVLGYYVLGKPYEVTDNESTVKKMDVEEYLRPIQYDYDQATTAISTEGDKIKVELVTVDGIQTPEEFLNELSKIDGYPGEIDAEDRAFDNYYKVDVDENGYGVYAYLCNYSEIQEAIRHDTELGELAYKKATDSGTLSEDDVKKLQFPATLTLSAQKDDATVLAVSTMSGLQEALAVDTLNVIQLNGDISIKAEDTLVIPKDKHVMLDLNGNTLTNLGGTAIMAEPGSSLTLTGGSLLQEVPLDGTKPANTYGVRSVGAEVVMNKMTIQDFQYGVYVGDNAQDNELDSRVYIRNSTVTGEICAAFISGNGLLTEQKSRLIIEGSILTSPNIVVSGNGDATGNGRWGTDIQILNSTLTGTNPESGAGIYQPQMKSTLTVKNSTVSGCNGIALKGGIAKVHNSTITAIGGHQEPQPAGSGFTDTGDSIYIDTGYGYEMQLFISGNSKLEHGEDENCQSLRVYKEDADNVLIKITSGIFQEKQPENYLAVDSKQEEKDKRYVVTSPNEVVEESEAMGDENHETTQTQ